MYFVTKSLYTSRHSIVQYVKDTSDAAVRFWKDHLEVPLKNVSFLFCFVLFCFVLFCFVLFCFVLFCFVLFCFVLFCFVLFCFVSFRFVSFRFVSFRFVSFRFVSFRFVSFRFVLFCFVLFCCDICSNFNLNSLLHNEIWEAVRYDKTTLSVADKVSLKQDRTYCLTTQLPPPQ